MINEILRERRVPPVFDTAGGINEFEKRREQLKVLLAEEEYGYIPEPPKAMTVTETPSDNKHFCAGRASLSRLDFKCVFEDGEFTFPVSAVIPKRDKPTPAFVLINFRPNVPDIYLPTEEIADRGYAVFSFCYNDVSVDSKADEGLTDGLGKFFSRKERHGAAPGKIAMWAWAAMRVMDHIETLASIDKENVAVIGHSRLGKTALFAGGYDERFKYVISNCSGCSGAAITRDKVGEQIHHITNSFPHWFCPNYLKNKDDFESRGYDQHFLMALTVPRHLLIGSAENDIWADPESEFLALATVAPAYEAYGMKGLVHGDRVPKATEVLSEGDAHYHVRHGEHYLSREDWNYYMDFIDRFVK